MFRVRIEKSIIAARAWSDLAHDSEGMDEDPLGPGDELYVVERHGLDDGLYWMELAQDSPSGPVWLYGLPPGSFTIMPAVVRNPNGPIAKSSYTTQDLARMFGKAPFTVRQACNDGLIEAKKNPLIGRTGEWEISNMELGRLKAEGFPKVRRKSSNKSVTELNSIGQ